MNNRRPVSVLIGPASDYSPLRLHSLLWSPQHPHPHHQRHYLTFIITSLLLIPVRVISSFKTRSHKFNVIFVYFLVLTQPSSFNSLASSYFRQSVIYPTVPIRYPVRYAHYRPPTDFGNSQYQDNNNNISYFNEYYDRDQQAQYSIVNEANETENRLDINRNI